MTGQRAVDAFVREQDGALQFEPVAKCPQRLVQLPKLRQPGKLIEGGNFVGHAGCLSGGWRPGNPGIVRWRGWCASSSIAERSMNMPRNALKQAKLSSDTCQTTSKR